MIFLAEPSVDVVPYKIALFGALMVMAFFEAKFYIDEHNLKGKKFFYKTTFIANTITGLFLFVPIYAFDLLVIGLYIVRSFFVGYLFIEHNDKKTRKQARISYLFTLPKNFVVFIAYNFVFFLAMLAVGIIVTIVTY